MNYSQEWQDKLNFYNGLRQTTDWETFIDKKYVDLNRWMAADIVFLDENFTKEQIDTPFPKFRDILIKVNNAWINLSL